MKEIFTTKDFYLSAYLIANGFELKDHFREKGFTSFYFENDPKLKSLTKKFYSLTGSIEPIKYSQAIRGLKGLIHSSVSTSYQELNNGFINKQEQYM
jgi:hypothetical protein